MMTERLPAYEQALKLLGLRSHFRRQLEQKLVQRGYPQEEIQLALDRLGERGYLDDAKLAAEVAVSRAGAGEGARRVRAELARRGVAGDVIDEAVAGALPSDDREAALETARRWLAVTRGQRAGKPGALARHLDRKGFSRRAILHSLRELGAELEIPDEP